MSVNGPHLAEPGQSLRKAASSQRETQGDKVGISLLGADGYICGVYFNERYMFCVCMNGCCFPGMMNMKKGGLVNSSTGDRFKAKSARIQTERNRKRMKRKRT